MITRTVISKSSNTNFKANFTQRAQTYMAEHGQEFESDSFMRGWRDKIANNPKTEHITVDIESLFDAVHYKATATSTTHPDKKPIEVATGTLRNILCILSGQKLEKIAQTQLPKV